MNPRLSLRQNLRQHRPLRFQGLQRIDRPVRRKDGIHLVLRDRVGLERPFLHHGHTVRIVDARGRTVDTLVEVNLAGEASKGGVAPDGLDGLLTQDLPILFLRQLRDVARPAEAASVALTVTSISPRLTTIGTVSPGL